MHWRVGVGGSGDTRSHSGYVLKVEPSEFTDGLALWYKALLETLSVLVCRTALSPGGTPTIPATPSPTSFLSPHLINTYPGNALELKSSHPVLDLFLSLAAGSAP